VSRNHEAHAMKSPDFDYFRANSLQEALTCLQKHGANAQLLAGGQSLLAMLNLRLATPSILIDISRIPGLSSIERQGSVLRIGALVTHRQLLDSAEVAASVPLLAQAVPYVAHLAIRNAGTIGGSLALADPAAEYPSVALALQATLIASSLRGERRIAAADYFQGLYQTALAEDEILTAVEFPIATPDQRFSFQELARRRGDYAMVGVACAITWTAGRVSDARITFLAMGDGPVLASHAMKALVGTSMDAAAIQASQQALSRDLAPAGDLQATPETKCHLARVLMGRALNPLRSAA
jgi:carbon-monoxide dehydrogenase medium subunit